MRRAQLRVLYALHRRYRPGDYETWKYIAPVQKAAWSRKTFEYGTWGWRDSQRIRTASGRYRCARALVLERLCQYGPGSPAQEARHPEAHHHRAHRTHVRRSDGTLCRGTGLRRHNGPGRDCGLFGRSDARRARRQHPELRQCRRHHQRTRRVDIFARRSECAEARRRIVTKSSMPLRIVEKTPAYWGVLFDNPPLNVVDSSVFEGLQELLSRMDASPDLRVVVFESANPEFYLAHYDMTGKSASVAR